MHAITREYLTEIVFKRATETIEKHRASKQQPYDNEPYPGATDEEILNFIISIPYFDENLKNFLRGKLGEDTIIISQAWENEFIKKTRLWAESVEWLHGNDYFLREANMNGINKDSFFLKLPY